MDILRTVSEIQEYVANRKNENKTVGFVPTMGALHEGHLSLIKKSIVNNDVSVVSVFVNPTQFNNQNDLDTYPRDEHQDIELLNELSVDVVFIPSVKEIYPTPDMRVFDFGSLDKVMEGEFRPGHFNGVAQVVSRLFDIVMPTRAYFGEKDFQQLAIIREMVKQLGYSVEIVPVEIMREDSGLAMSSRNKRLDEKELELASGIYKVLRNSKNAMAEHSVKDTIEAVVNEIDAIDKLRIEYFQIVDGCSLQPVLNWDDSDFIVGCIAVFCGDVRLIDNIVYKKTKQFD